MKHLFFYNINCIILKTIINARVSLSFMNKKKVVIIIPTYNESLVIEETLGLVFQTLSVSCMETSILVFDSASTDNTQQVVQSLQKQYPTLYLMTESKKTGLGSAYLQAMRYAITTMAADVIVEFDADLSHQPHYLLPMLEKMQTYDVVVGSRYVKGGTIPSNWGWHRRLLSRLGNVVARCFLSPQYKDFTSGFRASCAQLLKQTLPDQFISAQYAYKLELFWLLHKAGAKILEYPIEFVDRKKGESKLPANSILDSLRVLATLRFRELKR